jgi:glucuronoarabinoxylan endo-1,4-beta-xylanase
MEEIFVKTPLLHIAASVFLLASAVAGAQTTDAINFNTTYQTIRGYGTSTAWQPVLNSTQANNLYGVGTGQVGLTILRSRIDPSSTTGGSNWSTELQNAQQVQKINSQVIVFATPWTPPAAWKSNGSVDDGTLNTSDYDNFANYLNAFIAYEKAGGVNLYAISVQNEPDFLPDYESCGYSGAQMDAWIKQEGSKINTKLMMPESDSYNLDESDPTLDDSSAVGYVSIVAGHTYGVSPFYYTNAKNHGKDVWMTETTYTPAAGSSAQPTISDAIAAAELYHQSMAVAQYNAYVYWWTPLLLNGNSPNYYAYALGQYSKFVRPGYVMTGANNNPTSGVYVTSYKGNGNYVIVAVNSNGGSTSVDFSLSGATLSSVTPYQTSASNQIAQLGAVSVSNDAFTYSLPGQSITTFVGTGTTGSGFTLSDSASTLSVTQGSTATDTITVTPEGGFTGSVTFTASGLPSGVTASFSPTSSTTSSTLTLMASSTATTGGPVTVVVTGTSGSTTATTNIALTVGTGTCTATAIVPYVSVSGVWTAESAATVSSTSTVVDLGPQPTSGGSWSWVGPGGFTSTAREIDSIPLSVGVNVYTATYTNSCGSKSTQSFTITVSGSSSGFTLSPSASSLTVKQGASGSDTITVADTGGFTGSVAFTTSTLPSGVTAVFSPTSSATSSVLTLTASSTATTGAFTITVTGTSGSIVETTSFTLNVTSGGGSACTVDYTISPQNSSNFGANVTIVNGGSTALSGWSLTWTFANGQTIASSWNGAVSQSGGNVTVSEQSGQTWENIPANGSYSGFGFNGTWNGTTNTIPTNFALNGTACTIN